MKRYLIKKTYSDDNSVVYAARGMFIDAEDLNTKFIARWGYTSEGAAKIGMQSHLATAEGLKEITGCETRVEVAEFDI